MVYLFVIALSLIFAFIWEKKKINYVTINMRNNRSVNFKLPCIFVPIVFLILFLPAALRYGIGTDYFATYVPLYNRIRYGLSGFSEVGFNAFVKFLAAHEIDYQWMFIITSFLTVGFVIWAISKESKSAFLSIFFYLFGGFYFYGYSGIRQALATAIFLFALQYIKDKKFIRYLICILLAASVHTIAILYLFFYWLCRIKVNLKRRILLIVILIAARPLVGNFIRFIISQTPYGWYIGSKFDVGENALLLTLVTLATLALGLFACKDSDDLKSRMFLNIHTVAALCAIYNSYLIVGTRIVYLFFFVNVLSVPYFLSKIKSNIIYGATILTYILFAAYIIGVNDFAGILPYASIFSR